MLAWWLVVAALGGAAASCPRYCSCFTDADGYGSANCSTNALGGTQPSSLDLLSFQPHERGYPTKLAPRAFQAFRRVKFLWAVNCSILNLPNEVFHGLDLVIKMDLSHNKIRHLNGGVFKSLGSLHTLLLRGNPLQLTPWDVVVSDSLQELDLGHCGLRTIPQGTFISVPRLSRLYLDGNEIHTFTFNMIPAGLRYLNLARNRIANVPTDVLTTMSYLRKLDLSKNPVKCNCNLLIMQDWFSGQGIIFENGVTCLEPPQYAGQKLSKINENELCTLEEVKRQRRINDIESYSDSKVHRAHNMIHDPDLQADQPDSEFYSEVLFDNDKTRSLGTHMELSKQHYPLPSDLSDENNKLAASKHILVPTETNSPTATKEPTTPSEDEQESNEEVKNLLQESENFNKTHLSDEISTEDFPLVSQANISEFTFSESHTKNISDHLSENMYLSNTSHATNKSSPLRGIFPTDSPENEMADEGYSPFYTNPAHEHYHIHNDTTYPELSDEAYNPLINVSNIQNVMADEGYSPVYGELNITSEDEIGSGDESINVQDVQKTVTVYDGSLTTSSYNLSTMHSDSSDYSYDSQHDYSVEVGPTIDPRNTTELEDGSGDFEDSETVGSSLPPYVDHDNETSKDGYIRVESTTSGLTSETYHYSSSSTDTNLPETMEVSSENETYTQQIEDTTTELIPSSSTANQIDSSSEHFYISSSSTSESGIPLQLNTSFKELATTIPNTAVFSTSTESQITSGYKEHFVPNIKTDITSSTPQHLETSKGSSSTFVSTVEVTSTTIEPPFANEIEVISRVNKEDKTGQIVVHPTTAEREEGRTEAAKSMLTYVIAGLLVALIVLVLATVLCRKLSKMGPCTSKKKVRLPQDTEANIWTEMQDMLLPKPPENGVKIIPQNGTANGKDTKEEEVPVLQKELDEKPEPIETVTARMSILAGPQTPVFIHKTLA